MNNHTKEKKQASMSELPKGWIRVKVKQLYEEVKDKVEPKNFGGNLYIGLEHLGNGLIANIGTPESLKSTKTLFRKGDILYGKLRPYLNKHAIAEEEGICSTDIVVLRTQNVYSAKYLNYYFSLPDYLEWAISESKGINLPRLSPKLIMDYQIPLPPLNEQKRIVEKLDRLFANIDRLKTRLDHIPELLKQFRQSVLTQAVTGKLTHIENEMNQFLLSEIAYSITDGDHQAPPKAKQGVPFLVISNLTKGEVDFSSVSSIVLPDLRTIFLQC